MVANNFPQYLAVGLAWMISFGNCANIVSSNIFITIQAPRYPTGFTTGLIFTTLGFCLACLGTVLLVLMNRSREKRRGQMSDGEREADSKLNFKLHI